MSALGTGAMGQAIREAKGEGDASDLAAVTVEVPELCPRFTARAFTDVKIGPSRCGSSSTRRGGAA